MMPLAHIITGGFFSLIILYFFKLNFFEFLILFISTWFFIDLDIFFYFIAKNKTVNPIRFIQWHKKRKEEFLSLSVKERKKFEYPLRVFHSIEILTLILLFSLFSKIFILIFVGFIFHLILDLIDLYLIKGDLSHKVSFLYYLNKKQIKNV
ncbi:MAG: hypothetical protein QW273_00520 [Candidatus Pacearchaeota archaeon]